MPKSKRSKPWPVQDVRYVEVALTELTTRHLHVEFDHGIRIVVANEDQLPLAARLIEQLRQEVRSNSTAAKGGLS
ncbi:MAG: hypothetical protein ACSHYB_15515 [Roseibacillus sp.]